MDCFLYVSVSEESLLAVDVVSSGQLREVLCKINSFGFALVNTSQRKINKKGNTDAFNV